MCAFTYFLMIEDIIYKSDDVILQLVEKDCILDSSIASISFLLSTREHGPWFGMWVAGNNSGGSWVNARRKAERVQ